MNDSFETIEQVLEVIARVPSDDAAIELLVPKSLTLRGEAVPPDVAMAIILDRILAAGFWPAGVESRDGGNMCRYERGEPN